MDGIIHNAYLATADDSVDDPYGSIPQGSLVWNDGKLVWLGPTSACPYYSAAQMIDAEGACLTPGLIDCHTHLVHAGDRVNEFEWRLQGLTYEQIARQGGGINATVQATRAASAQALLACSAERFSRLLSEGVTTVEIKSGYGLDLDTELKQLRVANQLAEHFDATVVVTCLAAHAVPPEYLNRQEDYVDWIIHSLLPEVANKQLATAVDVFCERIAFSTEQSFRMLAAAKQLGLQVKGHVGQLSAMGGAAMVASLGGLSVDHVERLSSDELDALANTETVAVLLPGAFYTLQDTQPPPIQAFRDRNIPMAVATDYNPGTSPLLSLLTAMNMACVLFRLTPEEAFLGVTVHAAKALKREHHKGQLKPGYDADFVLWNVASPASLSYGIGLAKPNRVWFNGRERLSSSMLNKIE